MADLAVVKPEDFEPLKQKMLALIDEPTYLKEISFALQALNNSDYLKKCSKTSILTAVYNTATTGLSLNPILKFAALIPRYVGGQTVAVLDPMYQGLVKLVTDTGNVKSCYAYCVYEGDEFAPTYGTTVGIHHVPKFQKDAKITHAYAVAILPDGKMQIEIMAKDDLDYIRGYSESYKAFIAKKIKTCIWVEHEGEMCKKTVLKRLVKYLPKTDQYEKLATAIDLDNKDYEISGGQQDYLLSLLAQSTYGGDETGAAFEREIINGVSQQRYEELKKDFEHNRLDPVTNNGYYNQGDIKKHIKKLTPENVKDGK